MDLVRARLATLRQPASRCERLSCEPIDQDAVDQAEWALNLILADRITPSLPPLELTHDQLGEGTLLIIRAEWQCDNRGLVLYFNSPHVLVEWTVDGVPRRGVPLTQTDGDHLTLDLARMHRAWRWLLTGQQQKR